MGLCSHEAVLPMVSQPARSLELLDLTLTNQSCHHSSPVVLGLSAPLGGHPPIMGTLGQDAGLIWQICWGVV